MGSQCQSERAPPTSARLVLGDALNRPDGRLLKHWLLNNTTGGKRFRAGPAAELLAHTLT